jgi:ParB family transcriptional regulator, chromosome partitioning protein
MRIEDIRLELIDVPSGRRAVDPNWAKAIGEDMATNGQKTPIDLIELKEPFSKAEPRYRLVTGGHRYEGKMLFKAPTISARIYEQSEFVNEAAIRLAEIKENFIRRSLSVLDRAFDVADWRDIYEQTKGAIKPGKKSISRKFATNSDDELLALSEQFSGGFTEASMAAFGLSKDAVFRSLKISRISNEVRTRISLHKIAENQSELLTLSAEPHDRQARIASLLTLNPPATATVADAIAMIDHVAPVPKPEAWARLSDGFAKLPDAAKRRFIAENWDFIEAMLAEKAAA